MFKKIILNLGNYIKRAKQFIYKIRRLISLVFIIGIIYDVIFYSIISDWLHIILIILWMINIINFGLKSFQTFLLGAIIYFLCYPFQFIGKDIVSEKSISWFVSLCILSFVQKFLEKDTYGKWS